MLELGESGRYEFKRDVDAVSPKLLAALANWVAQDPEREVAHLLVGVEEVEDPTTGLVFGRPSGLAKGLDRAVARIQDHARETRPIPVDAFIVEEAVDEAIPFVRVEIRPTMAPHYDGEGRRQTRQGRSTRPLTDDELLRIYLDREAGSFAQRFRHASETLHEAVGGVGSQVDGISRALKVTIARPLADLKDTADFAAVSASSAESAAHDVGYAISTVEDMVRDLNALVEGLHDNAPHSLAAEVAQRRRIIWWEFSLDTWERTSARAQRLEASLRELLTRDISIDDALNSWELQVWASFRAERKEQRRGMGTMKWWDSTLLRAKAYFAEPTFEAPELPEIRHELQTNLDYAIDDPDSLTRQFESCVRDG